MSLFRWILLPLLYLRGAVALVLMLARVGRLMLKYGPPTNKLLQTGKPPFTRKTFVDLSQWDLDTTFIPSDHSRLTIGKPAPNPRLFDLKGSSLVSLHEFVDKLPNKLTLLNFGSIT